MVTFSDQIKANPLITLLVLVGLGLTGFLLYALYIGTAGVTVSGVLLSLVVLFGLGLLLYIIRGAGEKAVGAEDLVLIVMAGIGITGLAFLLTKYNPGTFAIYDAPLQEINNFVGGTTNLWIIFVIGALAYLFGTKRGRAFIARYS